MAIQKTRYSEAETLSESCIFPALSSLLYFSLEAFPVLVVGMPPVSSERSHLTSVEGLASPRSYSMVPSSHVQSSRLPSSHKWGFPPIPRASTFVPRRRFALGHWRGEGVGARELLAFCPASFFVPFCLGDTWPGLSDAFWTVANIASQPLQRRGPGLPSAGGEPEYTFPSASGVSSCP